MCDFIIQIDGRDHLLVASERPSAPGWAAAFVADPLQQYLVHLLVDWLIWDPMRREWSEVLSMLVEALERGFELVPVDVAVRQAA